VNDIQKLHRVIDSLEEQSAQVAEFNGLLSAVNDARTEIEAVKSTLANLVTEQGELVTKNSKKFEEFDGCLTSLNDLLGQIKDEQLKLRREVAALKFVTPDQFEQGCTAIDSRIAKQLAEMKSKLEAAAESQQRSISGLRTIVVLGILVLAGGIGFLAMKMVL
jgi:septal ring factor EnvC (AmiA/AmiB activator)